MGLPSVSCGDVTTLVRHDDRNGQAFRTFKSADAVIDDDDLTSIGCGAVMRSLSSVGFTAGSTSEPDWLP